MKKIQDFLGIPLAPLVCIKIFTDGKYYTVQALTRFKGNRRMFNFWALLKDYSRFRQFVLSYLVLATGLCFGQDLDMESSRRVSSFGRAPANYVPDDDIILRPVQNELSFYQQYVASDKSDEVVESRNQIKVWNDNQVFADQYGLDSNLAGSAFFVPTPEEKWEYFKNRYMRYLRRKGEQPLRDAPKNWYQEYRASNEVDTIDELEDKFKKSQKRNSPSKNISETFRAKEVNLWKETKFIFQPRVDQALVVVGIKGPIAYARAWVGVNGRTEINIRKDIESIGFRAMYNYETDTRKYFTSIDQRLVSNVYLRLTSSKDPLAKREDQTVMLLYGKQF